MCCKNTKAYCALHNIRDAKIGERVVIGEVKADNGDVPGFYSGKERVHVGTGQIMLFLGLSPAKQTMYGLTSGDNRVTFLEKKEEDWVKLPNGVQAPLAEFYGIEADLLEKRVVLNTKNIKRATALISAQLLILAIGFFLS